MIRVIINGAAGRMGKEVEKALRNHEDYDCSALIDPFGSGEDYYPQLSDFNGEADVIIDFSNHAATSELLDFATAKQYPVLIATTGHTDEELALIRQAAEQIPVFHASNMSLGVAVLIDLAKKAAVAMPDADIEIVETHHNRKIDAPSGTALTIANALRSIRQSAECVFGRSGQRKREKNEIGISAVRRGNIVGIHEVLISTDNETLTLKHEAHSRALFADGALSAVRFLTGQPAGLYHMEDLI